jgi:hypothetical protein
MKGIRDHRSLRRYVNCKLYIYNAEGQLILPNIGCITKFHVVLEVLCDAIIRQQLTYKQHQLQLQLMQWKREEILNVFLLLGIKKFEDLSINPVIHIQFHIADYLLRSLQLQR